MAKAAWYNKWLFKIFAPFLSGDILEVGCGIGNFTKLLSKYGAVRAIDINTNYITIARKETGLKTKIGSGDIEKGIYFFRSKQFDSIVCLNVLEHIKDEDKALDNLFKLLKPEGKLILLLPSHMFLYGHIDKSIGHFRRYNKSKIKEKLLKKGFKILKLKRLNFLAAPGWFVAGKILKETAVKEGNIKIFNLVAPVFLKLEKIIEPPIGISLLVVVQKQ